MILKSGIHNDVPESVYHSDPCPEPSISSSLLKTLLKKSPLHAYMEHPRLNKFHEQETKNCFDLGKAAHTMLLGTGSDIVKIEADNYKTKDAREQRDKTYISGNTPLLTKEYDLVTEMVQSARHQLKYHEVGKYMLEEGYSEQTAVWQENGLYHRARYDRITLQRQAIFDYKTTGMIANPEEYVRHIINMGYDISAAHYIEGEKQLHGHEPEYFFVVQEIKPPYAIAVIALTPPFLEIGRMKRARALSYWEWCMKNDKWPGYPNRALYVDAPGYELHKWIDEDGNALSNNHEENKELFKIWGNSLAPNQEDKP